jgi:oligopeptide/dipeptide ABC transporter ATP-binding protein
VSVSATVPLLDIAALSVSLRLRGRVLPAVNEVSFSVAPGRALGLLGESGSGKTLTALSILRLLPPELAELQGSIRFQGEELLEARGERLREVRGKGIGMVFQDPLTFLNPVLRVGEQIAEPMRIHLGISGEVAGARTLKLLHEVGLPDPPRIAHAYPHELSGGQRQRAMIAAALSCNPALVVADEPTTALDVTVQAQILALLDRERRERAMGLLLISHDIAVIAQVCDEVAVMYAGRIVERGPTDKVLSSPSHPYTAGLLRSVRALEEPRAEELPTLRGGVPALEDLQSIGCRFHDRCERGDDVCRATTPDLAGGVACHHPL